MPQKVSDVKSALLTKGFQKADKKKPDHDYYFFFNGGKKTNIFTKISHGEREIHDQNCSNMAKQMRLTNPQFRNFVDCPLGVNEYVQLLIQGKHIAPPTQPQTDGKAMRK